MCEKFTCVAPQVTGACTQDANCAGNEVCEDGVCKNPCDNKRTCGLNAQCSVKNHKKFCGCPQDFTGK